mgnify:CR=1 FL=1
MADLEKLAEELSNLTVLERKAPIDYKRENIEYSIPDDFIGSKMKKDFLEKEVESISKGTVSDQLDNDVDQKSKTADIERKIDEIVNNYLSNVEKMISLAKEP